MQTFNKNLIFSKFSFPKKMWFLSRRFWILSKYVDQHFYSIIYFYPLRSSTLTVQGWIYSNGLKLKVSIFSFPILIFKITIPFELAYVWKLLLDMRLYVIFKGISIIDIVWILCAWYFCPTFQLYIFTSCKQWSCTSYI